MEFRIPPHVILLIFILGGVAGGLSAHWLTPVLPEPVKGKEVREGMTGFTNPLLECDSGGSISQEIIPFSPLVKKYIDNNVAAGNLLRAAVYFRDLNDGPWFGINGGEQFIPASLLKVPIMIAYYKAAEDTPDILNRRIKFEKLFPPPATGDVQTIPPQKKIEVGQTYTVQEFIERMITYSDNQAMALLYQNIEPHYIADVYGRLGVDDASLFFPGGTLSAKNYATFFRILFNASYLTRNYSEKALKLLTQTQFKEGIVAGLPSNMAVAHKFGEGGTQDKKEIHDCGIVYYTNSPYLLCVMTEGVKSDKLVASIKDISALVYAEVDRQNHGK